MIKRNLSSFLLILAMLITIVNYDVSNHSFSSDKFWLFLGAIGVLIGSVVLILTNESKNNRSH